MDKESNMGQPVQKTSQKLILFVVVAALLMASIDISIVILALPTIDGSLKTTPVTSIWIILIYILVTTILSSQVGKIGDNYGRAKMFNIGLVIFIIGSLFCGLAPSIFYLIAFRVLQAVGGALVGTNSTAVLSDHFKPEERGKAFGYSSIGWNLGSILGIVLGGLFASIDWRFIFLVNIPIGLIIIPIAFAKVKDVMPRKHEKIDYFGAILLGISLTFFSLLAVLSILYGFNLETIFFLLLSVIFMVLFIIVQKKIKTPTIDLSIFKNKVFTFSILSGTLQLVATFSVLFMLILYLQGARGLSPLTSSLYLIPGYLIGGLFGPYMGKLSDKIGARILATVGIGLIIIGYLLYINFLTLTSPLLLISLITVFTGFGSSMFFPANTSAIMSNAPPGKYGMASGVSRMISNIGLLLSFVMAFSVVSFAIPRADVLQIFAGTTAGALPTAVGLAFLSGFKAALIASVIIMVLAGILSAARGKEDRKGIKHQNSKINDEIPKQFD